tara:strand:+ start:2025 stop:2696 length:672 start_codon:yes stop_codon:yes gene_type:complete
MAGLFTKAKKAADTTAKATKKATVWQCVSAKNAEALETAIHEVVVLQADLKAIQAKQNVHKTVVKRHAEDQFVEAFADTGVQPDSPMQVQNSDGEKLTYVVQDRCANAKVKEEQVEELERLFGEDKAGELIYEQTTFSFNPTLLAKKGVMPAIEAALVGAFEGMVESGLLTEEQSEDFLDCNQFRAFKPGTVAQLVQICGKDTQKIRELLDVMGSACVRYIKA